MVKTPGILRHIVLNLLFSLQRSFSEKNFDFSYKFGFIGFWFSKMIFWLIDPYTAIEERKKIIGKINLKKCPAGCKLDPLNKVLWDDFSQKKETASNEKEFNKKLTSTESLTENEVSRLHPNFIG